MKRPPVLSVMNELASSTMNIHPSLKRSSLKSWAFICILFEILIATLVLAGWKFNIKRFKYPIPNLVGMNPVTAISLMVLGVAFLFLFFSSSKAGRSSGFILATIVIATSLYKLIAIFFVALPQIDRLFYADQIVMKNSGLANNMASTTGISFILSGIAVLLIHKQTRKNRMPAHYIALAVLLFASFTLLGYLYEAPEFVIFVERYPMAVHTAACFVLISLAVLLAHPEKGLTKEFTVTVTGNLLGHSLFFGAIVIPVMLGLARIYFIPKSVISPELALTFFVCAIIIIFCFLIFYFLIHENRIELLRTEAENKLRQSEEIFRSLVSSIRDYAIFMLDIDGNIITWNKGAEAIKGYKGNEIKGKNISVFYTKEDQEKKRPSSILKMAKEKGEFETEGWRVRKDGSKFWADVVVTALCDDNGKLTGYAKVTRDITETKKASDLLHRFNEALKKEVDNKTSELAETTLQLRQLAAYLQTAREDERKSIAREIHDELGQMLTGLKMDVVWLRKQIMPANDRVTKRFADALELLNDTKQTMRRISTDLHPAVLTDLGLVTALNMYCKDFGKRSGIAVNFTAQVDEKDDLSISPGISIGLYRIFQESLTNIAKHANAEKVTSLLKKDGDGLILDIIDNGSGFDLKELHHKKTLGLVSIRERVIMMDGKYEINSSPGKGTLVHVSVPFKLK